MTDLLDTLKHVTVDDRRHRDRDPLLPWTLTVTGLAVARTTTGVAIDRLAAVVVHGADVRLVVQQPCDRRGAPDRLASRGRDPAVQQLVCDLPDRQTPLNIRAEDLAHDLRLGLEELDPRPAALACNHSAMAVGRLPERDLPSTGAIELAAPVTLGDLRALVLGDHALHLHQQRRLGILAMRGTLQKPHADTEALKLLEDQHLVGVRAREPIHTQTQNPFEDPSLGGITQAVQRRTV
jgi:hypothetical protein